MPHAGGGGSGGGFHSSGRGKSNFKSLVPKTDKYGHPHSRYYVGPGFYYNRVYIPFDSDKRMLYALKNSIIALVFTIIIMILYTLPVYFLLASPQIFMVGIFIFIACGFGLIAYISSFMFITAFSPYLDDVTKQYTDDDPDSWMKPIESSDNAELPASDDKQTDLDKAGSDKTDPK